jgi:hypothetical protein
MEIATTSPPQDRCCLVHRVFAMFGDPLFRRAESDGTPVLAVHLGEKEAAIPLARCGGNSASRRAPMTGGCST